MPITTREQALMSDYFWLCAAIGLVAAVLLVAGVAEIWRMAVPDTVLRH
jgi:hypothetical protein